jgi:hypothetical protein
VQATLVRWLAKPDTAPAFPEWSVQDARVPQIVESCGDMVFVAAAARIAQILRRPWHLGTCGVIDGNIQCSRAAVCAAAVHLQARVSLVSSCTLQSGRELDMLQRIIRSIANVLSDGRPVLLLADATSVLHPNGGQVLQAWLVDGAIHHLVTPEQFSQCFRESELEKATQLLLPGIQIAEV